MQSVNLKRDILLGKIKSNREAHRAIFEEATIGYRKAVIAELDSMIADAKAGKRIRHSINLIEPMDQTKEYDRVISMLEMSIDESVELEQHEFAQYVLDDWHWKGQFMASNMHYTTTEINQIK